MVFSPNATVCPWGKCLLWFTCMIPKNTTTDLIKKKKKISSDRFIELSTKVQYCAWTKINRSPGERGSLSLPHPQQLLPLNTNLMIPSIFLLSLMDNILSSVYYHVFKLSSIIFLGWVGVVVSRRFPTSRRKQ